ncbi:MAG: hypothetical protein WEB03_01125 [Nitriliruptor sp.]
MTGSESDEGGDPACWLDAICDVCGRIPDLSPDGAPPLDASGCCRECREG